MINARDPHLNRFLTSVLEEGSGQASRFYYDDPTTMGFQLLFEFSGPDSPLFNEAPGGESAIRYLRSIGETERADNLKFFKTQWQDLVRKFPYYWQELSGLESLFKHEPGKAWNEERVLTVKTLESIDHRVGGAIEAYESASFDYQQYRQMLPANLRKFRVHVLCSEIRGFRTFVRGVIQGREIDSLGMMDLNDRIKTFLFSFDECEFDFEESMPWAETLQNGKSEAEATNQFKIKAGRFAYSPRVGLIDLLTGEGPASAKAQPGQPERTKLGSFADAATSKIKALQQTKVGAKLSGVMGPYADRAKEFFEKEANEFLQTNDPRLVAERLANKLVKDPFDAQFSKFLLGNVFSKYRSIRELDAASSLTEAITDGGKASTAQFRSSVDLAPGEKLPELLRHNVLDFERAPFSALLQSITRASLGNVLTGQSRVALPTRLP